MESPTIEELRRTWNRASDGEWSPAFLEARVDTPFGTVGYNRVFLNKGGILQEMGPQGDPTQCKELYEQAINDTIFISAAHTYITKMFADIDKMMEQTIKMNYVKGKTISMMGLKAILASLPPEDLREVKRIVESLGG